MPIRPENRHLYPPNWVEISTNVKKEAGWRCEVCGVQHNAQGFWIEDEFWTLQEIFNKLNDEGVDVLGDNDIPMDKKPIKIVLTTAHLDHDPTNCERSNLKAMCQRHHNRYDAEHRKQTRKDTKLTGQLMLDFTPVIMTEEQYLDINGASRQGIGDCALHKNRRGYSDKAWSKVINRQADKDSKLIELRQQLREEYRAKVEKGLIRPPTRIEKLLAIAAGHPDLESSKAAKRILKKYGYEFDE